MVQWLQCQCGRVSGHNRWWRWANGHRDWIKQDPHFETWKVDVSTRRFCSLRRLTSDRSSRGCFVSEYCRVSDICYGKWSRESSPSAKQNFSQHKPTLQTTNWGHHQHPHNTLQYNTSRTVSRHISSNQGAAAVPGAVWDRGGLQPLELSPQLTLKMSVLGARYI